MHKDKKSNNEKIVEFDIDKDSLVDANKEKVVKEKTKEEVLYEETLDLKDKMLRLRAEFENYKKRNHKISQEMYFEGKSDAITAILPVLDSLDRAMEMTKDENVKEGYAKIKKQFMEILASFNLAEIEAEGIKFDVNVHDAVMRIDSKEQESGMVRAVTQKGYKLGDKVLRHSKVVVTK